MGKIPQVLLITRVVQELLRNILVMKFLDWVGCFTSNKPFNFCGDSNHSLGILTDSLPLCESASSSNQDQLPW